MAYENSISVFDDEVWEIGWGTEGEITERIKELTQATLYTTSSTLTEDVDWRFVPENILPFSDPGGGLPYYTWDVAIPQEVLVYNVPVGQEVRVEYWISPFEERNWCEEIFTCADVTKDTFSLTQKVASIRRVFYPAKNRPEFPTRKVIVADASNFQVFDKVSIFDDNGSEGNIISRIDGNTIIMAKDLKNNYLLSANAGVRGGKLQKKTDWLKVLNLSYDSSKNLSKIMLHYRKNRRYRT